MKLKNLFVVTIISAIFFIISCNQNSLMDLQNTPEVPVKIQNITIVKDELYLTIGQEYQVETIISPDSAKTINLQWRVNNPQVASVENNGIIKGLSCGTTQVTLSCDQICKEIKVVVRVQDKNTFRIHYRTQKNTAESYKEYGVYLVGNALPESGGEGDASIINDTLYDFRHLQQFKYTDSFGMYTDISVRDDGELQMAVLKNNLGFNYFTDVSLLKSIDLLSYNEVWFLEGNKTLYISKPVSGLDQLRIPGDNKTIKVGEMIDFLSILISSVMPIPGLSWQSSNQFVASVNDKGIITGIKPGSAVIMAIAGGLVAQKQVFVTSAVKDSCVRIHYYRYNGDYKGWVVETASKSYMFENHDAYGSYTDIPFAKGLSLEFTIKNEFETAQEYFDNTGNKRELWISEGNSKVMDTIPVMDKGAFKIVNSWGDKTYQYGRDWEHVMDGKFYMTYDALKKSNSFAYFLAPKEAYQPRVLAVFQVEGNFRGDFSINFGVGDSISPRKVKRFLNYPSLTYGGYSTVFPSTDIAFDLTDFLPLQNENVFMEIYDGGLNRTLKVNKFYLEIYDDYSSAPVQIVNDTTLPEYTIDGSTSRFILRNLTVAANAQLAKKALSNGYKLTSRTLTKDDLSGYVPCPARMPKTQFQQLVNDNKIKVLNKVLLQNIYLAKLASEAKVDNSTSNYFPPIGSQENKGSCTAWALGYYLATYNIARSKGWNLSGARWINGEIEDGYKDKIMSPDFIYNLINGGSDNGSMAYIAALVLNDIGISTMKTAPIIYDNVKNWPTEQAFREAPLYRHDESTLFYCVINTDEDIENIKALLKAGELVTIAIEAGNIVLSENDTYTSKNAGTSLDHLVTVVGFDDTWTVESK